MGHKQSLQKNNEFENVEEEYICRHNMIIRKKETLKFISEMKCIMPVRNFDTKFYNELNLDMILNDLLNQLDYKSIRLEMYQNKEKLIV